VQLGGGGAEVAKQVGVGNAPFGYAGGDVTLFSRHALERASPPARALLRATSPDCYIRFCSAVCREVHRRVTNQTDRPS
jgi:hypothetical protein